MNDTTRDLTDPAAGTHAVQLIVDAIITAVTARWDAELLVHRGERIVSVEENYDLLGYAPDAAARDARHTRYVGDGRMLRSQTSALIPGALRRVTADETIIACPGIVYRRDVIDRLHTGTPHQLDLWRLTRSEERGAGSADLRELVEVAVGAALPGARWRTRPAEHPYTTGGLEIEAWDGRMWVEIGECGVAARRVLAGAGLPAYARGLALGVGLDRLVMLRKGIDDIRLLTSDDPRVARQMSDVERYRPVSVQPAARRDLSIALPADVTAEDLGDRVRELLGPDSCLVEEVAIVSATPAAALPAASRERLAIRDDQVNVLLRVVLRDLRGSLAKQRANELRDRIMAGLTAREPATAGTAAER